MNVIKNFDNLYSKILDLISKKDISIILINGFPASGKSYLANQLEKALFSFKNIQTICTDDFLLNNFEERRKMGFSAFENKSYNIKNIEQVLTEFKNSETKFNMRISKYNHELSSFYFIEKTFYPGVLIVDGLMSTDASITEYADAIIWIDKSNFPLMSRRIKRDIKSRKNSIFHVLYNIFDFYKYKKKFLEQFYFPNIMNDNCIIYKEK